MALSDGNTSDAPLFEAVIIPHRSLTARGRAWLIGVICLLGCLTGVRFWVIGAWPVMAFTVVEIGFAVLMLSLNAGSARSTELVVLSQSTLRIVRTTPRGRREERVLSPLWLNVVLEERPGRVPGLLLVARHVREEIATTLGEVERRDLAHALSEALHHARNPRFNNPQLRESDFDRI